MQISVAFENEAPDSELRSPVQVGWLLTDRKAGVVFDPPTRVRSVELNKDHAKSASRCPAIINLESRCFEIKCPFDVHMEFVRDKQGRPALRDLLGDKNAIRPKKMRQHLLIVDEKEWRYKDRPTIQFSLPYVFICDEHVYVSQTAPFMHYEAQRRPGTIFAGRFPIDVWPRPLMWAFEWHDTSKPLILKRGEPLFYAMFETTPQERAIQMVEAQETEEVKEYLDLIGGAVNYVNQTFGLFKAASERRPSKLVVPVKRN